MKRETQHAVWLSLATFLILGLTGRASAGDVQLAIEGGAVWQTRNGFRIPGDRGTLVKLADYDQGPVPPSAPRSAGISGRISRFACSPGTNDRAV